MTGKKIRLERIINPRTGKTVIVPMDHGVTLGPISGIHRIQEAVAAATMGGADAVVLHKGMVKAIRSAFDPSLGLIVHLSASTNLSPEPLKKFLVSSVEEAVRLGADCVSVHVNIGNKHEKEMLRDLSKVALEAEAWGIPLLAMMYPRGEKVKNEYDPALVAHAARLAAELGADIVKVSYTGDRESFRDVVEGTPVPIVIAGGPRMDSDRAILSMVRDAMTAGARGTSIGRNVFQHSDPALMCRAIHSIVHQNKTVEEALELLWQKEEWKHVKCS
jgi:predicted phospho-2-dehydro-3-deoxyheptonate aldolase